VQENQLFYPQIKENGGGKVGYEKILQMVQKAHQAQGDEEIGSLFLINPDKDCII